MIDTVLNLLFRCSHKRLTRPVSPPAKAGSPSGQAYVVCLDCGRHIAYDTKEMRLLKALDNPQATRVPQAEVKRRSYLLWVPAGLALLTGVLLRRHGKQADSSAPKPR
jgi:hypothetical protein